MKKRKLINKFNQSILLEGGAIYDSYNNKKIKGSILIQSGLIKKVGTIDPSNKVKTIDCKGKLLPQGLLIFIPTFASQEGKIKKHWLLGLRLHFLVDLPGYVSCPIPIRRWIHLNLYGLF